MDLQKADQLVSFGSENGCLIELKKSEALDFSKAQSLPDLRHALSRVYTLKNENHPQPIRTVAKELWYAWIYINLPPITEMNIGKKLEKQIERIDKLKRTSCSKRGPTWVKEARQLLIDLNNGFDLRSFHEASINVLINDLGIEIGEEEELLYSDNCIPGTDGLCPRKRVCGDDDPVWSKNAEIRKKKYEKSQERLKKRMFKISTDKNALEALKSNSFADIQTLNTVIGSADENICVDDENNDPDITVSCKSRASEVVTNVPNTSIHTRSSTTPTNPEPGKSPIRSSYKNINSDIVEVMVCMESQFGVERRQVAPLLVFIMNKLAGQSWETPTEETESIECQEVLEMDCSTSEDPVSLKRKKCEILRLFFPVGSAFKAN